MLFDCIIARSTDGLLLCEVQADQTPVNFDVKRQAKLFLKKGINKVETNYQSIDPDINNKQLKALLKTQEGVSYMIFFDAKYNFKLACLFLDELRVGFEEEMKNKFGTFGVDLRSKLETIESNDSYCFQSFERFIKRKRQEFLDVGSSKNAERLKQEIHELSKILNENIQLLVDRDNNLTSMSQKAKNLKDESKIFKDKSRDLVWSLWLRQKQVYLIIGAFILIFVYLKLF